MHSAEEAMAVVLGVAVAAGIITVLALLALSIIARWKIFDKTGEDGWKAIIPVYSDYVLWKIGWGRAMLFWVALALAIIGACAISADGAGMVDAGGYGSLVAIAGSAMMLAAGTLGLVAAWKLMESFGKGVGWYIAYIIVPVPILLIVGYGASRYTGPQY